MNVRPPRRNDLGAVLALCDLKRNGDWGWVDTLGVWEKILGDD